MIMQGKIGDFSIQLDGYMNTNWSFKRKSYNEDDKAIKDEPWVVNWLFGN